MNGSKKRVREPVDHDKGAIPKIIHNHAVSVLNLCVTLFSLLFYISCSLHVFIVHYYTLL